MHIVAVTRWACPPEDELVELAAVLGITPYDLRLRIMGPVPVVMGNRFNENEANRLLATLLKRGHGAVCCAQASIVSSSDMLSPRDFSLETTALVVHDKHEIRIPFEDITALVYATQATTHSETQIQKKKKFSLGRTALTGGLVRSKKVKKEVRSEDSEREQVLYIFCNCQPGHFYLVESRLRYTNLAHLMCATTGENFKSLLAVLKTGAYAALFDDRLALRPRKSTLTSFTTTIGSQQTTQSNASENDLIAHLILIAHQQKQF